VCVCVCVCIYIYIYIYNVYLRFSPSCVCVYTYIYSLLQGTGSLHTYPSFPHRFICYGSDTHASTYTVLLLPFIRQTTKLYFPWISLPTIIHRTRHCFSRHVAVYVVDNWIMTARGCKRLLQLRKQRDCDLPI